LLEKRLGLAYHYPTMLTLGIDTSEARGGVALQEGDTLLGEKMMQDPLHHAEELPAPFWQDFLMSALEIRSKYVL